MKNKFIRSLLFLVGFLAFGFSTQAQISNGAPTFDIEIVPKCNINGTDTISFYTVELWTVGNSTATVVGNFDAAGTFTIPGGSVTTLGYCGGGTSSGGGGGGGAVTPAADSLDFEVLIGCDTGTSYFDVVSITPGGTMTVIGTFDASGNTYSPTTRSYRPCSATGYQAGFFRRRNITADVSISGVNLISLSICNIGVESASMTVDGILSTILPGQEVRFTGFFDPVTGLYHVGETVSLTDVAGTTLHVFEQRNQ